MSEIADIHAPFIRWLREQGIPYINARSDRESTIAEGHPDFTLIMRNRCLLLEMKTKKGKLRPEQAQRIAELEAAGNIVHVVRDVGTAIELADAWRGMLGQSEARPEPASATEYFARFGEAVFRSLPDGGWEWVRLATASDAATLPKL